MADSFSEKVFGPGGLISQHHESYEYRGGQIEMAEAIALAFADKKHLIVEAGTGTGKTLAYLIPAINEVIAIEAPSAATPVAVIPAALATPSAHD